MKDRINISFVVEGFYDIFLFFLDFLIDEVFFGYNWCWSWLVVYSFCIG